MKEEAELTIYTDGGSRGNPGEAAYGFVVYDKNGKVIYEEGKRLGIQTNNFAEYSGVKAALSWVRENIQTPLTKIQFFLDSQLAAEQLSGRWKIKNESIRNFFYTIKGLEESIGTNVSYSHVLREKNKVADRLVNMALDEMKN